MDKQTILEKLNFSSFYKNLIPSLKINGKTQAMGLCPFHDDHSPSLSINISNGFYNCFSCCKSGDVFDFYQKLNNVDFKTALHEIAKIVGVIEVKREVVATFQYKDANGNILYIKERIEPGRDGRRKEFVFKHKENGRWVNSRGSSPEPYNFPNIVTAKDIFIVEGEAKVDLLAKWGLAATCLDSGAQSSWQKSYYEYFHNKESIIILPDNDEPGRKYAENIANALFEKVKSIKVVNLPALNTKEDIIDWSKTGGNDKQQLLQIINSSPEWKPEATTIESKESQWQKPIPLEYYSNLPEFPADLFPFPGREIIEAITEVNQVDSGLPGGIYLAILSTCLSKKIEVDLITHREPVNLYICPVLDSGERKTSSVNLLAAPLYEYQQEKIVEMKKVINEAIAQRKIDEARLLWLQKDAARSDSDDFRTTIAAMALGQEMEENPIPTTPVYIADDITCEALGTLMADNDERLSIISTEGGIFGTMAGRYQESQNGNFDIYLKGHAGDPWASHRIGRKAKLMLAPSLTVGLAVQRDVIKELGGNKRFRGRGLLARFLYVLCSSKVGIRKRQSKGIPLSLLNEYSRHIKKLMNLPLQTKRLSLTSEALSLWEEFYDDIESELRRGGHLEVIKDWGSKLAGAVARISGLLHCAEHGEIATSKEISVETVHTSIVLGNYFKQHALAAFGLMQEDYRFEAAKKIVGYLNLHKPKVFKGRDVLRNINSFKKMEDVDCGMKILLEREYIKEIPRAFSSTQKRGRPEAISYKINPYLFI